ncbi:MAG: hypothetical protein QG669_326 [Patescibacteria group bacterium]|nr:hypothetical protein [Patescibacteria group bacterium]
MDNQAINYKKYLLFVVIVGIFAHGGLYFLYHNIEPQNQEKSQNTIITENKQVSNKNLICRDQIKSLKWDDKINVYEGKRSGDMSIEVVGVKDEKYDFLIKDVFVGSIVAFVGADCHFYTTKFLNVKRVPKTSYDASLWQYTYTGEGKKVLDFTRRIDENNSFFIYNLGYSVDPKEKFVALSHGNVYEGEITLTIKDLNTLNDFVVIDLKNGVFKEHPEMFGDILFENAHWSKDGKYFLTPFHDQADVIGYIRVNLVDGSHQVYDAYPGTMGGDQINADTGWTTFDDGPEWSGWSDIEESNRDEWRAQGIKVNFGIYNIYTKQKIVIEQVNDTTHWHEPRWIDDNTLEYLSITGEKKIYTLPQ